MKKFIIFMFISLFLPGCFQSVKKLSTKKSIENVSFEHVDINRDGNITKLEFATAASHKKTNYIDPAVAFASIMSIVGVLIVISSFLNLKKREKNV
jgi:PBP1b-binding outer membrane lipoprotein LpoB